MKKLSLIFTYFLIGIIAISSVFFSGCDKIIDQLTDTTTENENSYTIYTSAEAVFSNIPEYNGENYISINNNDPFFTADELTVSSYEFYSELDKLGRCGYCMACIGIDLMPTEERGQIGSVKPSGWHTVKYDFIEGKYLYNRCHLIGYQLSGENKNTSNLITGTRYLNNVIMLPFENMIADYVKNTGKHVLYRVTPVFKNKELVARGLLMEAMSVEDAGEALRFNIFCFNIQPGIVIDYLTGDSHTENETQTIISSTEAQTVTYIINKNTKTFHEVSCSSVNEMKPQNKKEFCGSRNEVIASGYKPCSNCKP